MDKPNDDTIENLNQIKELGTMPPDTNPVFCLTIIGQVEGHMVLPPQNKSTKYEHILPLLVGLEQNENIKGVLILLNTVGGDVEAGMAMAEMISTMSKPTVSLVLGGGHSIGVPLAVSADYSFIAPTATMTIHPVRIHGLVIGVPQTYQYFNKMQDRVVSFVSQHSNITQDEFTRLLLRTDELVNDVGTILVGKEAADYGIIDAVGGLKDALNKINSIKNSVLHLCRNRMTDIKDCFLKIILKMQYIFL